MRKLEDLHSGPAVIHFAFVEMGTNRDGGRYFSKRPPAWFELSKSDSENRTFLLTWEKCRAMSDQRLFHCGDGQRFAAASFELGNSQSPNFKWGRHITGQKAA